MTAALLFVSGARVAGDDDERGLGPGERSYVATLSGRRRVQSTRARTLLRQGLARVLGGRAADLEVAVDAQGKPHISNGPWVSLAHSGEAVAALVDFDGPCGVDVEDARAVRDFRALASAAFGARPAGTDWTARAFYDAWCLREARFKAGTVGASAWTFQLGPFRGAAVTSGAGAPGCWSRTARGWAAAELALTPAP